MLSKRVVRVWWGGWGVLVFLLDLGCDLAAIPIVVFTETL